MTIYTVAKINREMVESVSRGNWHCVAQHATQCQTPRETDSKARWGIIFRFILALVFVVMVCVCTLFNQSDVCADTPDNEVRMQRGVLLQTAPMLWLP